METNDNITLAKLGDRIAYGRLVRSHERLATMWAWNIVGDFHIAQDVAQDAFVIAFKKLEELREPAAFAGWLNTIVRREALKVDRLRKSIPVSSSVTLSEYPSDVGSPSRPNNIHSDPEWLERHAILVAAIQGLPEHEQDVVVLYYLEDHPTKEVAKILGRPLGTVTKQLSRAIERLQNLLVEVRDESK